MCEYEYMYYVLIHIFSCFPIEPYGTTLAFRNDFPLKKEIG